VPAHIDQARIPRGAIWHARDRFWYALRPYQRLAGADATLADLHRLMEARAGIQHGTVGWLLDEFHQSTKFADLAESTRGQYDKQRAIVKARTVKGGKLGEFALAGITRPGVQKLVEQIAKEGHPTKANHVLRYLRVAFRWGLNHGRAPAGWRGTNPGEGVEPAKERKQFRMPTLAAMLAVQEFARAGAAKQAHTEGSVAPYLWAIIEIAYRCRLRGIELCRLTDASASQDGLRATRVKGSNDNVTQWSEPLRAAWDALVRYRDTRRDVHRLPTPLRAEDRHVLVSQTGQPLSRSGLDSAWQDLMVAAIKAGVILPAQRFTLHGLKHRGITDTKGNKADKQTASGHKSAAMLERYDHDVPVVKPAGE
jgi:hypothetical protein